MDFMRKAIEKAREGLRKGQAPFGACVVKDGETVSCAHNTVWADMDPTAHAEVNAIREACRGLDTIDLSGCSIYTTTEPCPMCFAAIHWAKLDKVFYGASIEDAKEAGFSELTISAESMGSMGGSGVEVEGGVMEADCRALFREWLSKSPRPY